MVDVELKRLYLLILEEEYYAQTIMNVSEAILIPLITNKTLYFGRNKRIGNKATVFLRPKNWCTYEAGQ
jgi:hypothetical protein